MPHQIGVTIRAMVAAEQVADLRKWLTASAPQGLAGGPFRFRHMRGLHFAKLFPDRADRRSEGPADPGQPGPHDGGRRAAAPAPGSGQRSDKSVELRVELRGFESLTLCMPCSVVSFDGVALGPVLAFQSNFDVWGRLAQSGGIWWRWYLVWFWFAGRPLATPALAAFDMNPEGATFHLADHVGEERLPGKRQPRR
jgi:hypothetical protein